MAVKGFWRDLGLGLADLVFAGEETCVVCARETLKPGFGFCDECLQRLSFLTPPFCDSCGRMLRLDAVSAGSCRECGREKLFFSRARAACLYEGAIRIYLHEVKYHRSQTLARALAGLLATYAREQGDFRAYQLIIPVPLHAHRLEERGFNQALLLAQAVGETLHRTVSNETLIRLRRTETQSRLVRDRRRENVDGAFRVLNPAGLAGKNVLLVDDILTTGYTASECARVLLRAGARDVGVLTLANGILEEQWLVERQATSLDISPGGDGDGQVSKPGRSCER